MDLFQKKQMTGNTLKEDRRNLYGTIIISVLVIMTQNGVWGLTSNRWIALNIYGCKTAMSLSRQVSEIQFKVSFFNNFEKDFSGFKPPCQVSKQGTAIACTCPLNRMPG